MAMEAALKLKETRGLHAEGYSLAEIMQGPMEIVSKGLPIVAFAAGDASEVSAHTSLQMLERAGASILQSGFTPTASLFLNPVAMIQSFYLDVEPPSGLPIGARRFDVRPSSGAALRA